MIEQLHPNDDLYVGPRQECKACKQKLPLSSFYSQYMVRCIGCWAVDQITFASIFSASDISLIDWHHYSISCGLETVNEV